ncbi:MAG: FAD-dependent oxidoreductase [Aestuariivirgaceae bacterium]
MKSQARVVIVGGGIMGVGLLYHLVEEGWSDVVLVEKGELTSGSTWHAAGQCPHFNGSLNLTKMHVYGTELYPRLEALTGVAVSWHGCGGVRLAFSDDEVDWFQYVHGLSRLAGYEAAIVGPNEIKTYHPLVETHGVKAAYVTFTDGHVAPADITNAMAAGARQGGAAIYRRCRATDIRRLPSGEWEVVTERGNIRCEHVVNAAGSYADVVGAWTGHTVPIANVLHHYVITEPLQELIDLDKELPVLRDPSSHCYIREETNGVLVGPYETAGGHLCFDGGPPAWDFESELVPPELERLMPWLEKAGERLPLFNRAGVKSVISGAITHTPDSNFLLGPAHGAPGYWMANGASIGICQGAGAGKYLAQWMVHGQAEINMREFDPRRFGAWAAGDYAAVTAIEDYHHMYYCYRPGEQHEAGRPVRKSSLHERLGAAGAQYQQVMGWERPRWYDRSGEGERYSFRRSNWFKAVREECLAVRNAVGLMDLSSFAKYEIKGAGAHAALSRLCANRIPSRDGGIVLTHMLTEAGFIESELTVSRLAPEHYFLLSAATAELQDEDLLRRGLPADGGTTLANVTEAYGTLILAGPRSREVLASLTEVDLANEAFPWLTGRIITVAGVEDVRALRINYVGELGFELHCPMAAMPTVFDALMREGERHGIRLFGTYAMNSLRMEKAYRAWGGELTNEVTMIEGAMERFVDLRKDFIGKAATLKSKQEGPRIRLVYLEVDATDSDCRGNEPIYLDGRLVGITTGGAFGHAVGKSLAFAYVEPALASGAGQFAVELYGVRHAARIIPEPAYDPNNARLKG